MMLSLIYYKNIPAGTANTDEDKINPAHGLMCILTYKPLI